MGYFEIIPPLQPPLTTPKKTAFFNKLSLAFRKLFDILIVKNAFKRFLTSIQRFLKL
ncbi:hypothetical protein HMPREF1394_01053 [Helicobacter pylori GAM105Ai]|nr:hypothetical protein HMPREF1394_01053 [Helicobacter pylori GAM105Ai]